MKLRQNNAVFVSGMGALAIFLSLWLFVLFVNFPIITFDMMYFEQPIIYLANQKIGSITDLLQVYLHPRMLEALSIPFFRPSGHFLIYQIITQFLDWHNTKGFLVVNFTFLALACYMMIRLYALFFPRYRIGGYIACGIYLMHPALLLSRLSPMHFEFASVFFLLAGMYCFVLFCQKNQRALESMYPMHFKAFSLIASCVLFYCVSVTFKEVALMLGPVMMLYFCLQVYHGQPFLSYMTTLFRVREIRQILVLFTAVALMLATYLSMAWSTPPAVHGSELLGNAVTTVGKLGKILFGFAANNMQDASLQADTLLWEAIIFPPLVQWILWFALGLMAWSAYHLYIIKQSDGDVFLRAYRKSFLFLMITVFLFLLMPIAWGRARPWHLSLSLVFFSLMVGFCFDYFFHCVFRKNSGIHLIGISIAIFFGLTTLSVANINIHFLKNNKKSFALQLNRNAVLSAPAIQKQLNADSVVVVEDSLLHNDYLLGDSIYPFELYGESADINHLMSNKSFYEFPYVYGGTLFRWAYLMPSLHEQVYPFQIGEMNKVPDVTIYNWLQHYDNIFCVGYDSKAIWHDRTADFKKNLLAEKARRHLVVQSYHATTTTTMTANTKTAIWLPFDYISYCQFECDKNTRCLGFTGAHEAHHGQEGMRCYFHEAAMPGELKTCDACQNFMKV
jgi:hypothetical protein